MRSIPCLICLVAAAGLLRPSEGAEAPRLNAGQAGNPYGRWQKGPPSDPAFFPIAVWLQSPRNAARYKAAGFNVYVGLWNGPTEEQLSALKKADLRVVCDQNAVGLAHRQDDLIVAWMHGDEPDNAQSLGSGKGYGPPVLPEKIVADYERIRKTDPTRPVLLNLGQGVAWDGWHGRGVRTNHPEDYPEYARGCDIASFDIYPVVHDKPAVAGKLWYVPQGVERLRKWTDDRKVVWNCIECTRISNPDTKPTPEQVRAEVWMSLIHGSMGLVYFVHQFRPRFVEAAIFEDEAMLEAVTRINRGIRELAPVLNSPSLAGEVEVTSSEEGIPIAVCAKRHEGTLYVFAVAMRPGSTRATFRLQKSPPRKGTIEVLDEDRTILVQDGAFEDAFGDYAVHLYRIR